MNRSTWLGRLFRRDRVAARAEVVKVLRRYKGNLKAAAFDLGFDRRYMFRILWRETLWPELDAIRAAHPRVHARRVDVDDAEWIASARRALRKPGGDT